MNIIEIQDSLKDLPDNALMKEMQMPTGTAPQFLVLSELKRRKRMRDDYQRQQNADMKTVAEEVVTAAGMPQEGIMGAARAMAPNTNVAQNTGMGMAAPVPATRAPQPQMMADGGIVRMQTGGFAARPGPMTGGVATAISMLRENYPDVYEQYKDDPNALAYAASQLAESAKTPELTGLESLETDMTAQAAPFIPKIPMDTSGETRPISPNMTMFNLPIGQFGQMYDELSNKAGTLGVPDYKLQYESAKPGEYFYRGNSYILEPDGTMYRRGKEKTKGSKGANIPVSDDLKNTIIAENVGRSVIENYGQPPTSNIAPLEKLIADQQEGAPVESVTSLIESMSGQPIEVDPAEIAQAQVTPTPDLTGFEDAARATDALRMMEINKIPERITVPTAASTDAGLKSLRAAPAAPSFNAGDSAAIQGSSTLDFAYEPGSPAETDAIREYLRGEGSVKPGLIDELDRGAVASDRIREDSIGARESLYFPTSNDIIRSLDEEDLIPDMLNRRAQEYLQSDLSTPKEEVYGQLIKGDPLERAKYEEQSPEYINALSQQLAEQELYNQQIADQKVFDKQDAEIRAADLIGGKITSDQPEEPVSTTEELASFIAGKVRDAQNHLDEKNLRKEADIERAGYESAAIKAAEMEKADAAELKKTEELRTALDNQVSNILGGGDKGGSKSGAGASGLESEIIKQLKEMEMSREKDKWMSLAEAGFKMMSSDSPTLLGAIGEGGAAGAKSLREGKAAYNKDMLTLLALQQRIDASKRSAAAKGSGLTAYQSASLAIRYRTEGEKLIADGRTTMNPNLVERGKALLDAADRLDGLNVPTGNTDNRTTVPAQI